jgi:hypothetical protein
MMPLRRGKILPPFPRCKASEKFRLSFLRVGLSRLLGMSGSHRHHGGAAMDILCIVFVTSVLLPSVAALIVRRKGWSKSVLSA